MTDHHCHLLPQIDDGASDVNDSLEICKFLHERGFDTVLCTPHYIPHIGISLNEFTEQRGSALRSVLTEARQSGIMIPTLRLGAEVRLEQGVSQISRLDALCLEGTNLLLLELPYTGFQPWIPDEIHNVAAVHGVRPVLAHINRYWKKYSDAQLEAVITSVEGSVVQLNYECFGFIPPAIRLRRLERYGCPTIYGTDLHMPSEFSRVSKNLRRAKSLKIPQLSIYRGR